LDVGLELVGQDDIAFGADQAQVQDNGYRALFLLQLEVERPDLLETRHRVLEQLIGVDAGRAGLASAGSGEQDQGQEP